MLTQKQIDKLKKNIADIKRTLAAEKESSAVMMTDEETRHYLIMQNIQLRESI